MSAQLKVLQEIIDLCETALGDEMMTDEQKADAPVKEEPEVEETEVSDESSDVEKLKALKE